MLCPRAPVTLSAVTGNDPRLPRDRNTGNGYVPPPVTFSFMDHSNVAPARFDVNENSCAATLVFKGGRGETNHASGFLRIVHVYRSGVGSAVASPPKPRTRKLCSPSARSSYRYGDAQLSQAPWSSLHSPRTPRTLVPLKETVHRNVACDWSVGRSMMCPGTRARRPSSVRSCSRAAARRRQNRCVRRNGRSARARRCSRYRVTPRPGRGLPPLFAANCTLFTVSVSSGLRGNTSTVTSSAPCLVRYD